MQKKFISAIVILAIGLFAWRLLAFNQTTILEKAHQTPTRETDYKKETLRIGIFEPLTGANKEGGLSELEGIQLANELYPMVNGNTIELYIEDNESDRYKTVDAVMALIENNQVHALIGSWGSSYSLAAGPIINEEEIPTVGASCTNPRITIGNRYYSRVSYIDTFQGTALAKFAHKNLKAKTVSILMEQGNEYSTDLGEYFMNAFAELNNYSQSILMEGYYQTGQKDFSILLNKVKLLNPDVIFIPGNYEEVAEVARECKEMGITSKIIGTDTLDTEEFIKLTGADGNGIYFSTFYSHEFSKTEESKKFLLNYRKKYGKDPNSFSALGYDAYMLIFDSFKRVNKFNHEEINNAIHLAKNVEGAAGIITMDQNGDAKRGVVIKQIRDQLTHYVTNTEPEN